MTVVWNEFLWQKTQKKQLELSAGTLGYEECGQYIIFCAAPTVVVPKVFWSEVRGWVEQQQKIICGYYLTQKQIERLQIDQVRELLTRQVGVRRLYESKSTDLNGGEFEEVRRALLKGKERGLEFKIFTEADKNHYMSQVLELYDEWKIEKGALDLEFFITPIQHGPHVEKETWVGVFKDNKLVAFVSLIPTGSYSYYVDQMIFSKSQAKWSMNYLFAKLIEQLPLGGSIDLGLCPLANIKNNYLLQKASQATEYLPLSYNFNGLYEFKKKFSNKEEKCFAVMQKKHSLLKQYKAMLEVSVNRLRYLVSF